MYKFTSSGSEKEFAELEESPSIFALTSSFLILIFHFTFCLFYLFVITTLYITSTRITHD